MENGGVKVARIVEELHKSLIQLRETIDALSLEDSEAWEIVLEDVSRLVLESGIEGPPGTGETAGPIGDIPSRLETALRILAEQDEAGGDQIRRLILALLTDAIAYLSAPTPASEAALRETLRSLEDVSAGGAAEDAAGPGALPKCRPDTTEDSCLDDAAALLIQLEPENESEMSSLLRLLDRIIQTDDYPDSCRDYVQRARVQLQSLAGGEEDSEPVIDEAGRWLEQAMDAWEKTQLVAVSPPPVETAPPPAREEKAPPPVEEAAPPAREEKAPPPAENGLEVSLPEDADPDLLNAFLTESAELIGSAEEALLSLENRPDDLEAVRVVFRAFHTIKGTSAFLELTQITELAHLAENLLSRIRDGEIRYEGAYTDLALRSVDMLKELIRLVQEAVAEHRVFLKPEGYDYLIACLADPKEVAGESGLHETDESEDYEETDLETDTGKPKRGATDSLLNIAKRFREPERPEFGKQLVDSTIRVPVERLDRFVDMVGELVVAHSMVAQDETVASGQHHELVKKISQTGKIVRELQTMSMSMRMIPLRSTFRKMARLVRDLARKSGKKITFITDGEDTEIDRNMVDFINDPLVHMVRNAVDHGVEPPEDRRRRGKPEEGTIRLSAYHTAGNVVVEIRDDGRGLNRDRILKKAVERGIVTEVELRERGWSDREVFNLLFMPGFSTTDTVSEVSGRGVGMDVVKTNVEALRGQVEVISDTDREGSGSAFKMSLPLTLAIIDGMVVRVGEERYVIPTVSIVRSVQPRSGDLSTVLKHGEMLVQQGRLIPIFRLAHLFEIKNAENEPTKAIVVVVEDNGRQAGLLIDELVGSQQIVIKTLGEALGNLPGISGSAIMPNGRVGLILDVGGLVKLVNSDAPYQSTSRGGGKTRGMESASPDSAEQP